MTNWLPVEGADCYQVANERGVTPAQAAQQMKDEGWEFVGYNDCGEEVYTPPARSGH